MARVPTVKVAHPDDPTRYLVVNAADADQYEPWEEGGEEDPGDEAYICGAETASGGMCSRQVDAAGERCYQHQD